MPDDIICDYCGKLTPCCDMDHFTDDYGVRKFICDKCSNSGKGGPPMQTHSFDD